MKHTLLALTVFMAIAPSVRADDAQKAIQAQYDKRSAAALKKDVDASLAINTPDFVSLDQKGQKRTMPQLKHQLTQAFATFKSYTLTTRITSCVVKGDTATVKTQDSVTIISKTQQEAEATSEDLWVKKNGQWLRTQNKLLTNKLKSNKPLK